MKFLHHWVNGLATAFACVLNATVQAQQTTSTAGNQNYSTLAQNYNMTSNGAASLHIGIVNTKKCLENSKLGKQEQANFEKMKNQMEAALQDKERMLEEIESKLNDDDYMDSISEEAANELNRKKRTIRNEGMQLQSQSMQALQAANIKIIQKLTDVIAKASAQVAQEASKDQPIELVLTDEACTYYAPHLDISDRVVAKMNAIFDAEQKDNAAKAR
jgi:outer membrane protein